MNWQNYQPKPFGFNPFRFLSSSFDRLPCGAAKVEAIQQLAKLFENFFLSFFTSSFPLLNLSFSPCFQKRMQMYNIRIFISKFLGDFF